MFFKTDLIKDELESVKKNIKGLMDKFGSECFPCDYRGDFLMASLLFLSIKLFNGKIDRFAINLATVMEEIYLASLLHDEIIDDNTIKAKLHIDYKKKNKTSILIADYILSIVITFLLQEGKSSIYHPVINSILDMCEGGLIKLKLSTSLDTEEEEYIHTIEKGFASLTSVSAEAGAIIAGSSEDDAFRLRHYGRDLGIAFKLSKDFFEIKNLGKDKHIYNFNISIPLLYTYSKANNEDKDMLFKFYSFMDITLSEEIKSIIHRYSGFEYTLMQIDTYINSGRKHIFPLKSSDIKDILFNPFFPLKSSDIKDILFNPCKREVC